MSSFWRNWVALTLATVPAAGLGTASASAQSMYGCYAQITSPYQGSSVAFTGAVEGRAATDGVTAVWVLTHRKGIGQWWPQNGGPVQSTGDWSAKVTYGAQREAGQAFEIAAVPVDRRTNDGLVGWIARANAYNEFGGIPLPRPAQGCRYSIVQVQRVQ